MRDYRDAKTMAQTLREALKTRSLNLSHSESLELTARMLGFRDWNVLAARIQDQEKPSPVVRIEPPIGLPVLPLRDIVVFPEMTLPLFVGRPKSARAVERAMTGGKRLLLLAQKRSSDDDPGPDDLHQVGITAEVMQVMSLPDGSMKLMVRGLERVRVTRLVQGELLQAEHESLAQPVPDERAEALAGEVVKRFEQHANVDLSAPPQSLIMLSRIKNPGLLADMMAPHLSVGMERAQDLLETTDPAERLEKLLTIMPAGRQAA